MKASYKKENYLLLAYGKWFSQGETIYLIVDKELNIIEPDASDLKFTEYSTSEYIQNNQLNFGRDFFLHKSLVDHVSHIHDYTELKLDDIWSKSKLANFFLQNNYNIPQIYRDTVLNTSYKLAIISGFLTFTNCYINIKHLHSGWAWEELNFWEELCVSENTSISRMTKLNIYQYERGLYTWHLMDFLRKYLYEKETYENQSKEICNKLFRYIDAIFIDNLDWYYTWIIGQEEIFMIEYQKKCYCLAKGWFD